MSQTKQLKLFWTPIKSGVDAESWKIARVHLSDNPVQESETQVGEAALDKAFVLRKTEEGIARLREILFRFRPDGFGNEKRNNILRSQPIESAFEGGAVDDADNPRYWVINLNFDIRHIVLGMDLISECNAYVVFYVMQEWCRIALPKFADDYIKRMTDAQDTIERIIYRKTAPTIEYAIEEDEEEAKTDTYIVGFSTSTDAQEAMAELSSTAATTTDIGAGYNATLSNTTDGAHLWIFLLPATSPTSYLLQLNGFNAGFTEGEATLDDDTYIAIRSNAALRQGLWNTKLIIA